MTRKTYRGKDLDVSFDLDVCTHSGECVRGLPAVFDTKRRPWILPDGAEAGRVRDAVARCPSGALEIVEKSAAPAKAEAADAGQATVTVTENGPVLVKGAAVVDAAGNPIGGGGTVALCRCGRSEKKPLCDGSHSRSGWTA